jgi:hypothetical protein
MIDKAGPAFVGGVFPVTERPGRSDAAPPAEQTETMQFASPEATMAGQVYVMQGGTLEAAHLPTTVSGTSSYVATFFPPTAGTERYQKSVGEGFTLEYAHPFQSLGSGTVGHSLQWTGPGVIFTEDPALAAYSSTLGLPVACTKKAAALNQASFKTGLCAATSLTPAGKVALDVARRYLSPGEMLSTNPGYYHDTAHPVNVAGAVGEVAAGMGRSPNRIRFLEQVGLLHDFDERLDPKAPDAAPKYGSPARVQVTLAWMDKNRATLRERMGWSDTDFKEAKALIARTDFPFDDKPRNYGTAYDSQSPQALYRGLLSQLPPDRRAPAMEDGVVLSFADQVANYLGSRDQARDTVYGLGTEIGVPGSTLLKGSAEFQKSVGADVDADRRIAHELQIPARIASAAELESCLEPKSRQNLNNNRAFFAQAAEQA